MKVSTFEPIHTSYVLSKFIFNPDIFENLESSSRVWLRDLSVPSSIAEVSSAYCDILNSILLIFMPFIVLFFLIFVARNSAQITKKGMERGDRLDDIHALC